MFSIGNRKRSAKQLLKALTVFSVELWFGVSGFHNVVINLTITARCIDHRLINNPKYNKLLKITTCIYRVYITSIHDISVVHIFLNTPHSVKVKLKWNTIIYPLRRINACTN